MHQLDGSKRAAPRVARRSLQREADDGAWSAEAETLARAELARHLPERLAERLARVRAASMRAGVASAGSLLRRGLHSLATSPRPGRLLRSTNSLPKSCSAASALCARQRRVRLSNVVAPPSA
jgi:hypothetical protein